MGRQLLGWIITLAVLAPFGLNAQAVPCPNLNIGDDSDTFALDPFWDNAVHQAFDESDFSLESDEDLKQLKKNFGMLLGSFPDKFDIYTIQRDLHGYRVVVASREGVIWGFHCGLFITP